ncbi:MAG TPA: NAD-dependent epimerase/dehydratase family protein [Flavobacteriaceae bacterium]|nr:NAD-dependent epimerase/dehydratase family protein [Flavobacteriaceae bacterium]
MILVSGSTGLSGRHLLLELLKGDKPIRAMYRTDFKKSKVERFLNSTSSKSPADYNLKLLNWFKADLNDIPVLTDAFEGVTEVYHCAGLVSFDVRDKDKLRKVNIEGTANMVNIALAKEVRKFCYMSSVAALGDESNSKPISEKSERVKTKTYNYYEISKFGAEMEVWRASQEGLKVVIVNPAIIIGPGNWTTGSGQLFHRIAKGFPFRVPKQSGFVSVEDVVRAMVRLMNNPVKNEGFILVSEVLRFSEVTDQIAKALNRKPPKYNLKKWMVFLLWFGQSISYIFGGKKEINLRNISSFFSTVNFDNSKIHQYIDFEFTPLREAVKQTAAVYLEEHS